MYTQFSRTIVQVFIAIRIFLIFVFEFLFFLLSLCRTYDCCCCCRSRIAHIIHVLWALFLLASLSSPHRRQFFLLFWYLRFLFIWYLMTNYHTIYTHIHGNRIRRRRELSCLVCALSFAIFYLYINNNHKKYLSLIYHSMSHKNLWGYMAVLAVAAAVKIKGERNSNLPTLACSFTISLAYGLMHNLNISASAYTPFCYYVIFLSLSQFFFRQKHAHKFNALCYSNQYNSPLVKMKM